MTLIETYSPVPLYATIDHLRPERSFNDRVRALLTWLAGHELDPYSVSVSDSTTVVGLRTVDGAEAAAAALTARDALPGATISASPRYGSEGLVLRVDGDVPEHGAVRVTACVDPTIGRLILSAEGANEDAFTESHEAGGAGLPVELGSIRVAAGLAELAEQAQAVDGGDDR